MTRPVSTRVSNLTSRRRNTRSAVQFLAMLLLILPSATSIAEAAPPQPLHTNQAKFRIPFEYDAEEMARLRAVEIQLYVSTNQGRDWEHADSVVPSEARFTFEASEDAEYWFAVRTLDASNQRHPAGPLQPGLRVMIDRATPEFEVSLRESARGEVELTWNAEDEHLDINSINLEFLDANLTEWQPVAVTAAADGRTSWSVPRTGRVLVRGSVADLAGNVRSAEASVELGGVREEAPKPVSPDFTQPVAENPSDSEQISSNPETSTIRSSLSSSEQSRIQSSPLDRDEFPQVVGPPAPASEPVPQSLATMLQPERMEPVSSDIPRVNSALFNLNYQFDEVGPSGVGEVDLYITEDNGQTWSLYGSDDDRESPFLVQVSEDGAYGLALRVHSGAGLSADPPQPGQSPEMTVVVDRRPPQAELLPIRHGTGASPAQIRIQWRVADEELAERPVALYYATQMTGPWEPITGWSENTGEYTWNIGSEVPERMYIRLEARDAAGNLARVESETSLVIDLTRPTARIVDVESIQPD